MKHLFIYFIGISILAGCHSTSVNQERAESLVVNETDMPQGEVIPGEVLYGPETGPAGFTAITQADFRAIANEMRLQSAKLASLRPFPRYREGVKSVSREQAHGNYLTTVASLENDPILPVFRQRYARLMLLEYGPLYMGRSDISLYYVNQLLDGGSREFKLMTDEMTLVKSSSATPIFQTTLNRLMAATQKRAKLDQKDIASLTDMIQKQKADAKARKATDIWSRGTEIALEKIKSQETDKQLIKQQALASL